MKLSKNFSDIEWQCKCGCGQNIIHQELVDMMQKFRDLVKKPVIVHCVNRCQKHNDSLPHSVKNSQHVVGKACDFHVKGLTNPELHALVLTSEDIFTGGIGLYDWGCHVDIARKRQWDSRKHA